MVSSAKTTRLNYPYFRTKFLYSFMTYCALTIILFQFCTKFASLRIAYIGFTLFITVILQCPDVAVYYSSDFSMAAGSSSKRHEYSHAAVATDHAECSRIGRNILHHGGSAVDSAIASMLCLGVVHPHSTGLGGGGFMLVYHRYTRFSEMIDFRENAPLLANKDMFHGDLTKAIMGRFDGIFVKFK